MYLCSLLVVLSFVSRQLLILAQASNLFRLLASHHRSAVAPRNTKILTQTNLTQPSLTIHQGTKAPIMALAKEMGAIELVISPCTDPPISTVEMNIDQAINTQTARSDLETTDNASVVSQTSTIRYDHIPFDKYEPQVQELCRSLWPAPDSDVAEPFLTRIQRIIADAFGIIETTSPSTSCLSERFHVEHMRGGGYNRVTGINTVGQDHNNDNRMVLRAPRMGVPQSDQDVTNLQFVRKHTNIPAPDILANDSTGDNALNEPYVIQSRIPGYDLESKIQSYPSLSHEQKIVLVEEFCQILLDMQEFQHPWAGQITRKAEEGDSDFLIGPFEVFPEEESLIALRSERLPFFKSRPFGEDNSTSTDDFSDLQTPLYFMEVQFARWRNLELGLDPSDIWLPDVWQRLQTMAKQMDEFGCLDCDSYCLTHYDLDPRNIMVEIQAGIPKITGIIDWDLAMFAPDWVSCKPPMWIWNWVAGGNEDESRANEEPPTEEQQELKDLFDDLVGFDFRFMAYQPHYRLARQLFRFTRYGLRSADARNDAEKVLEEWEELYAEKQAAFERRERERAEGEEDGGPVDEDEGAEEAESVDTRSEDGQEGEDSG